MNPKSKVAAAALAVVFLSVSVAQAADPQALCENAKLKAAGKRELCLAKEAGKAQLGKSTDLAKCETKFTDALSKADTKAADEGTSCRYIDNGDDTVSDLDTGLMWQKTDDLGGLTDKDNAYSWSASFDEPDGTAFTDFLYGLNGGTAFSGAGPTTGCYAGHCDWRMPLIEEWTTIVDCSFGNPCIDQSVFGATNASFSYWSATTGATDPFFAWVVSFSSGFVSYDFKTDGRHVRAVRGGL